MNIIKRMLKIASEKDSIWDRLEQQGYYDSKSRLKQKIMKMADRSEYKKSPLNFPD